MEMLDFASPATKLNRTAFPIGGGTMTNFTINITGPTVPFQSSSTMVTAFISLPVFILGLLGNTLAIFVILRYAKMKTVTNLYILNLAVADELYILGLPLITTQNVLSYWPFGSFMCRLVMTADSVNQFTSIFCLTVMSIDRYLAVVHPIKSVRWRRPRVAKIINAILWTLSIVAMMPVIIFWNVQDELNTCNISWPEPQDLWSTAFILYTATLGFFLPLFVICICYLLIVIKVKSARVRAGLSTRRRSERKVTLMVVIMVVVFVLCWLPFFVLNSVNLVTILPENNVMAGVYFFSVILTYVNSCANPLLYGFLSENFKQSIKHALCLKRANRVQRSSASVPQTKESNMAEPLRNHDSNNQILNNQVQSPPEEPTAIDQS
ncbi:hypothetical protein GJAV_G00222210 [Gymnothorax javanicus]|nr:hypothetical protein GJAV_G00222210 [Gymnothorax javanicus]